MAPLALLLKKLLTADHHDAIVRHRRAFDWMANCDLDTGSGLLEVILLFDKEYGKTPDEKALKEFFVNFGNTDKGFKTGILDVEMPLLDDISDEELEEATDIDVLIAAALDGHRRTLHQRFGRKYADIAMGEEVKFRKKDIPGNPDLAMDYLKARWAKLDFVDVAPPVAGLLHENTEYVTQGLIDKLSKENKHDRILTGLPHIDQNVVIGRNARRFIGICGLSGDGKTLLLNTLVYNAAAQGKNILYVSIEHDPTELWEFMAFLHATHFKKRFLIPSLTDWEQERVTEEDIKNISEIIADIKARRGLPGLIDAQQFFDWDDIVAHLESHHKRNHYDMLVVDYIAHLETPGEEQYRDKALERIITKAQSLSRKFDNGRGIVIVSPMQVNKEASKAAKKAGEGEKRYDLNAIRGLTQYAHDMDFIMSVYSDDDMKRDNSILVETLKLRKGKWPDDRVLKVDARTKLVHEKVWEKEKVMPDIDETKREPPVVSIINVDEITAALGAVEEAL